jgi:curved DNA-binding protein CbpA
MDLYEILGVGKKASDLEIQKAYRKLARKYHPDVSTEQDCEAKFKEAKGAYEVLSDPERRAHYDATGGTSGDTIDPPRDILMMLMKDALIATLDMPSVNLVATVRLGMDQSQDNINKRIALLREALGHLKKRRSAVKRKNKGHLNLFHVVVDREVTVLTDLVETKLPSMLKHLGEARRMFNDYEKGEAEEDGDVRLLLKWWEGG